MENMPPPPLPSTTIRGKKRKSIPASETATGPQLKKPRKSRALTEKQKGKQKAIEVANDTQEITTFKNPSSHPHALEGTARHNEPRATRSPSTWIVNDAQHLQHLFSAYSLPEILQVDIEKQYSVRILDMMLTVFDQSQRILKAYFVPYIWFPEDSTRPYKLRHDDKYFWGQRIHEYHHRVQCGRIAYTITGRPILFFKCEEREIIDSINYNIILNAHRRVQAKATPQCLPGNFVGVGSGAMTLDSVTSSCQVPDLPTQENPPLPNVQAFDYNSTPTETTIAQPCLLPSTSVVDSSADLPLNNEADINGDLNYYNIPSIIEPEPQSQSLPELSNVAFNGCEFNAPSNNDNDSANIDPSGDFIFDISDLPVIEDTPSIPLFSELDPDYVFNINDLPVIEDTPSNEISPLFSESASVDPQSIFNINDLPVIGEMPSNQTSESSSLVTQFNDKNYNLPGIEETFSSQTSQSFSESSGLVPQFNDNLPCIEEIPSDQTYQSYSELSNSVPQFNDSVYDLPRVQEISLSQSSQPFSESSSLAPQFNDGVYDDFDADSFFKSFDPNYGTDDTTIGSTLDSGPSNIAQSLSEFEKMYMNLE